MINSLTDIGKLERIRKKVQSSVSLSKEIQTDPWKGASTEIRQGLTFEDLMKEQQYQPISFEEFQSMVSEGEWTTSLEELLTYSN
ncbi:MAG: hypothetical protein AAF849_10035 [Bacteroidota bacterium]